MKRRETREILKSLVGERPEPERQRDPDRSKKRRATRVERERERTRGGEKDMRRTEKVAIKWSKTRATWMEARAGAYIST